MKKWRLWTFFPIGPQQDACEALERQGSHVHHDGESVHGKGDFVACPSFLSSVYTLNTCASLSPQAGISRQWFSGGSKGRSRMRRNAFMT